MVKRIFATMTLAVSGLLLCASPASAAPSRRAAVDTSPEAPYYKIIQIPIPDDIVLECGGL